MTNKLYLIANAHIDPIWQWELDEGLSAALSTFYSAADLCEKYDFIFCHNESLFYQFIEQNAPELFERIKKLVKEGKWCVIGGWFLQPDVNQPSGESIIRQVMVGRKYFLDKFGVSPRVSVNFDSFGHPAGLVQVLKKTGYEGYLFTRPSDFEFPYPSDRFVWRGPDGSEVVAMRRQTYNTLLGHAALHARAELEDGPDIDKNIFLWGVGNHGGGPSRKDLEALAELSEEFPGRVVHATPEKFLDELDKKDLPVVATSLQHCMPGCYISQSRMKRGHRLTENLYFLTEKLMATVAINGLADYAESELEKAQRSLLLTQFHDMLPGSSVRDAEKEGLDFFGHANTVLRQLRARAMIALSRQFSRTKPGEYTVVAFNPHPYEIDTLIEAEFMLADQNHTAIFKDIDVYHDGQKLVSQLIKERSNIPLDWRKRIAFRCKIPPMSMQRFDLVEHERRSGLKKARGVRNFSFEGKYYSAKFGKSGFIEEVVNQDGAFMTKPMSLTVYTDDEDSWGMRPEDRVKLGDKIGKFALMGSARARAFCACGTPVAPMRIIEDGPVMTVVESSLYYKNSSCNVRTKLYRDMPYIDVELLIFNDEKNSLLKLELPLSQGEFVREGVFSTEPIKGGGSENVMQRFVYCANGQASVLAISDGSSSCSVTDEALCLALLRGCAYTAHPLGDKQILKSNRFSDRVDQGEREFRFRFYFGAENDIREKASVYADQFLQAPYAVSMCLPELPPCDVRVPVRVDNSEIGLTAFKASEKGGYIVRLFNNSATCKQCVLTIMESASAELSFGAYEVKTIRYEDGDFHECDMMEI